MRWARCILAAGWMAALLAGCAIPGAVGRGPSHPKTAHDHYLWGEYYRRTGKFDKAIESFTTSIALSADASNADSFLWRADCRRVKGDREGALADLDRAVALRPESVLYRQHRVFMLTARGQRERALEDCNWLIAREPNQPMQYATRANIYCQLERYEPAVEDYGRAIELSPEDQRFFLYYERALALDKLEKADVAAADYRRFLDGAPSGRNASIHATRAAVVALWLVNPLCTTGYLIESKGADLTSPGDPLAAQKAHARQRLEEVEASK